MFLNTRRRFLQIPFVDSLFSLKKPVLRKADQPSQKPEVKIIPERVRLELWRRPYLQSQGPEIATPEKHQIKGGSVAGDSPEIQRRNHPFI